MPIHRQESASFPETDCKNSLLPYHLTTLSLRLQEADGVKQYLEFALCGRRYLPEARLSILRLGVRSIPVQHVNVNIEIERRRNAGLSKALHHRDGTGPRLTG